MRVRVSAEPAAPQHGHAATTAWGRNDRVPPRAEHEDELAERRGTSERNEVSSYLFSPGRIAELRSVVSRVAS